MNTSNELARRYEIMKSVENTMQTQFNNGTWGGVVNDDFVIDYWGSPEYLDVDMHFGWSIVHNSIMPGADIFKTHLPNTPISEPATPLNEWEAAVQTAPIGTVLELSYSLEFITDVRLVKTGHNEWHHVIHSEQAA